MSKNTFEFKKKIVLEYLNVGIDLVPLAKKYGIKSEFGYLNIRNMEMKPYVVQEKMKNILSKKRYLL